MSRPGQPSKKAKTRQVHWDEAVRAAHAAVTLCAIDNATDEDVYELADAIDAFQSRKAQCEIATLLESTLSEATAHDWLVYRMPLEVCVEMLRKHLNAIAHGGVHYQPITRP